MKSNASECIPVLLNSYTTLPVLPLEGEKSCSQVQNHFLGQSCNNFMSVLHKRADTRLGLIRNVCIRNQDGQFCKI